jgi:PBP1b-binding outer membrane lipoprotein LpoB
VQLDWKPVWLLAVLALALLGAGCSGVNTSQSVSPATFLLPGFFGQTTPPPADATAAPTAGESVQTVAQSN